MNSKHPIALPEEFIFRSWQRCQALGLQRGQRRPAEATAGRSVVPPTPLAAYGRPVVEDLAAQMAGAPSVVVLADSSGTIVCCAGDAAINATHGLCPGASWAEGQRGTNAIGTCLVDGVVRAVAGQEHFLDDLHMLAGVAAPIFAPPLAGDPLLVDVPSGVLALFHPHAFASFHARALLEMHAGFIEDRLIAAHPAGTIAVRLHAAAEAIESPLSGLLVFTAEGRLVAKSARCAALVPAALGVGKSFAEGFATPWPQVAERSRAGESVLPLLTRDGRRAYARVSLRGSGHASFPGARSARSLADLGSDDPRIGEAVRRAGRIVECDIPLLIQGETGSGKEWFAQAFHHSGSRRDGPFVAVNCAAIPATLIEAELFGYSAGAFTGANRVGTRGKIREADGGTLFLDEIGDMPLSLQAVLLRVLETRRVTPLGNDSEETVDIRLVCASHQALRDLVGQGSFRADLFFRLSGMTVVLPPLRERSDFAAIVRRIVAEESPGRCVRVAPEAFALLRGCSWPGNLRQLRNVLRLGIALLGDGELLTAAHLPAEVHAADGAAAGSGLRAVQARLARESVGRHGGNISAAARELGITRTTLYRLLAAEKVRSGGEERGRS